MLTPARSAMPSIVVASRPFSAISATTPRPRRSRCPCREVGRGLAVPCRSVWQDRRSCRPIVSHRPIRSGWVRGLARVPRHHRRIRQRKSGTAAEELLQSILAVPSSRHGHRCTGADTGAKGQMGVVCSIEHDLLSVAELALVPVRDGMERKTGSHRPGWAPSDFGVRPCPSHQRYGRQPRRNPSIALCMSERSRMRRARSRDVQQGKRGAWPNVLAVGRCRRSGAPGRCAEPLGIGEWLRPQPRQ